MTGSLLLLAAALTARLASGLLRAVSRALVARLAAGLLAASAAWMIASAAGGWGPWWLALVAGAAEFAVEGRRNERSLRIALEALVVPALAALSIPPMSLPSAFLALCGTILLAALVERWVPSRETRPGFARRVPLLLLAGALWLAMAALGAREGAPPAADLLEFGVTPLRTGEPVPLRSGAMAWLERPQGRGAGEGALLFHGANPDGAHQASASVLRRALLDAGYVVLSVDHPGYGRSRSPSADAGVTAWDPLPVALDGFQHARRAVPGGRVLLVGHSLGTSDVLRLLPVVPEATHAVLFGAGFRDPRDSGEYWYERFHTDRRMPRRIPRERYERIRLLYYDNASLAAALRPGTAPILFVRFGHEHSNIQATRDSLYRLLGGPKSAWTLSRAKHSFNSLSTHGLLVGDTRIARQVADLLRSIRDRAGLEARRERSRGQTRTLRASRVGVRCRLGGSRSAARQDSARSAYFSPGGWGVAVIMPPWERWHAICTVSHDAFASYAPAGATPGVGAIAESGKALIYHAR